MDVWIISLILLLTRYLLVSKKISVDLTARGLMVVAGMILIPRIWPFT